MAQLLSFTGGKDYVIHNGEQVKAIFFYDADAPYGFLGNWYRSSFQVDGVEYTSMEQYLMERKCLLFGDQQSAERIMATDIPENQMAIGRTAKGYMDTIWAGRRQAIAMRGLYAKFSQNPALTKQLLDTGDAWLVRCSALDTTWAIGIAINKEERRETAKWRGTNLLGFALMEVREMLRSSCSWSDETAEVEVADQTMISIPTAALPVEVVNGDITKLNVDCIVNAANHSLLGGGGVDGAIHRAAGPGLLKECITLGGCRTGEAKITAGYKLPAKWVIHTVGPVYNAAPEDPKQLADCYKNSLDLARSRNLHSIAFPAISTGVYGYPLEEAAKVAADTVRWWLETNADYEMRVIFCCFGTHSTEVYQKALDA